jgi:hypothetical protein
MGPLSIDEVLAEEAAAINNTRSATVVEDLKQEAAKQQDQRRLNNKDADTRSGEDESPADVARRKAFYRSLNKLNRAALCLSGGGIRSATFSLGVIQALAAYDVTILPGDQDNASQAKNPENSLLGRFQFLSTVSGGGYIGSWLSAWRHRSDFPDVWRNLTGRPDGSDVEPPELSWLRAYSNYLTPRLGVASADAWTDVAICLRNLILNWLVIIPIVCLALIGLKLVAAVSVGIARSQDHPGLMIAIGLLGIACLIVQQAFTTAHRPTRRELPGTHPSARSGNINQAVFLKHDLVWSLASAVAVRMGCQHGQGPGDDLPGDCWLADFCRRVVDRKAAPRQPSGFLVLDRIRTRLRRAGWPWRLFVHFAGPLSDPSGFGRESNVNSAAADDLRRPLGACVATRRRDDIRRAG